MHYRRYLLPLLLLLALALRLINLGERSLWYDEAFAVLFAGKGLDNMLYGTLTPVDGGAADIHPLLYYVTLNGWMQILGESPFAVRLWSVLLGVATVGVIYLLARDLFDENTALASAFITAIAPFHVQYSQETRMYALLGLLLMLATWCFLQAWRATGRVRWRWWVIFGVLSGLAMYTQQLAAFYLIVLGLIPFIARRRNQITGLLGAVLVAFIIYLPWLVNLPGQFAKVRAYYWIEPPNLARPLLTARTFLVVGLDIPAPYALAGTLIALFLLLFLLIQVIFFLRRPRNRTLRRSLFFVLWLAVVPPALMWLVSQVQPVYLERALLPSALLLYIALGWMFTRSGLPRPVVLLIALVGLLPVGIGLYYQYTWATFPNSPFQDALAFVRNNWQVGDVVIHPNKLTALPSVYYERILPQHYLADAPGSPEDTLALPTQQSLDLLADACAQAASSQASRVWWLTFDFAADQYSAQNRPEFARAQQWLDDHYTALQTQHFNDLELILYDDRRGSWSPVCETG